MYSPKSKVGKFGLMSYDTVIKTEDKSSHPTPLEVNVVPLFPTPATVINISRNFTDSELQTISKIPIEKEIIEKHESSKEKGTESSKSSLKYTPMFNHRSKSFYVFDEFNEGLKDIKLFCEEQVKHYFEEIEGVDTKFVNLRITQSWLNVNKPEEFHHAHDHPNSYLSGVFYFNCLPNDCINFAVRAQQSYGATSWDFPQTKLTIWNATGISQDVRKGDLILFPSWVPHHVIKNETNDTERISLSFNTFPIGEMGGYKHATHLIL